MPLLPRGRSTAPRNSHQGHVRIRLRWRQRCGEGAFRTGSCAAETLAGWALAQAHREAAGIPFASHLSTPFLGPSWRNLSSRQSSRAVSSRLTASALGHCSLRRSAAHATHVTSMRLSEVRSIWILYVHTVLLCKQWSASKGPTGSASAAASTSTGTGHETRWHLVHHRVHGVLAVRGHVPLAGCARPPQAATAQEPAHRRACGTEPATWARSPADGGPVHADKRKRAGRRGGG